MWLFALEKYEMEGNAFKPSGKIKTLYISNNHKL